MSRLITLIVIIFTVFSCKKQEDMGEINPYDLNITLTRNLNSTITIDWSPTDSLIQKVRIFRGRVSSNPDECIATINDSLVTSYTDEYVPVTDSVYYQIWVARSNGTLGESNIAGTIGSKTFELQPTQIELHPDKPIVYISSDEKIYEIDYDNLSISSEIEINGEFGYFHVGNNNLGNELYIPRSDGQIDIYNLEPLSYKESVYVDVPVKCVISNNNGLLFASVSPEPWWDSPVRSFKRSNHEFIDGGDGYDKTRLRLLPSGNEIIGITTTLIPTAKEYFKFDESGHFISGGANKHTAEYYPLDADIFKVAPANNFFVTSSSGAVYKADSTIGFIGTLDTKIVGDTTKHFYTDFEFNSIATKIYAISEYEMKIFVFDYLTLSKINEVRTRGFPLLLCRKDKKLIVVSFDRSWPMKIGFEIFVID